MNKKFIQFPKKNRKKGFTLIEVLTALTVGGIILASILVAYANFIRLSMDLNISREMQTEMNFVMAKISDNARNYEMDFESSTNKKLIVGGETFEFKDDNLWLNEDPMFSGKFIVEKFGVEIITEIITGKKIQPKVEIALKVSSKQKPEKSFELETTISSRIYK